MDIENYKKEWNRLMSVRVTEIQIEKMLSEKTHPILKNIRIQLLWETAAWILFTSFYYSAFDGENKPLYSNVMLIAGSFLLIGHNLMGYFSQKNIVKNTTLVKSLDQYAGSLITFKKVALFTHAIAFICLVIFFISVIRFTNARYAGLVVLFLILVLQLSLLNRIWNKRINRVKSLVLDLTIPA